MISVSENEFNNHSSVQIIEAIYSTSSFQFKHVNIDKYKRRTIKTHLKTSILENLVVTLDLEVIAPSVTNLYNRCIEAIVTGQLYGKWESSLLFQRKATSIM